MAFSKGALQFVLVNLSLFGFYAIWGLFMNNDAGKLLRALQETKMLPGTIVPMKTEFTGVPQLDRLLVTLNTFFWHVLDGRSPAASLQILHFGGQYMAMYTLYILEGVRQGNKGRATSYAMFWGLAFQMAAVGTVNPILLAVALSNTSMVSPSLSLALPADPVEASTIPISILLGFALPSVLQAVPASIFWSHSTQQNIMAIWQGFPILCTISQQALKFLVPRPKSYTPKQKLRKGINAVRAVYAFTLLSCAATHIPSLTISISSVLFPSIFESSFAAAVHPAKVNIPIAITPDVKVGSPAEGVLLFLQWDEIISTGALLLYAAYVLAQKCKPVGLTGWAGAAVAAVALDPILGPAGIAIAMIWARDEILFAAEVEKTVK